MMEEEMLNQVIERYNTDREIVSKMPCRSLNLESEDFDFIFPRLERAAINQISDGGASISRYGIWAKTIHRLMVCCIENLKKCQSSPESLRLLTKAANSLRAFSDIQSILDPLEVLDVPKYLNTIINDQNVIQCKEAYFIKLGNKGEWEDSSIGESIIRIGWKTQNIKDINRKNWDKIEQEILSEIPNKGAATRDLNALKNICESQENDIWVTFYLSKLWWTKVGEATIYEDDISKFRKTSTPWSCADIDGNQLLINKIPGQIAKIQGFRGTICKVKDKDTLIRIINSRPSEIYKSMNSALETLELVLQKAIKQLHWKDFETFVDLVFRGSGWRRVSMLGEAMKFSDLELEDPITHDKYQVQIKSSSTLSEFQSYLEQFSHKNFRKLYYIVHSPTQELSLFKDFPKHVELLLADKLAKMAIEIGLTNWLLEKIK
ncbi:MAG: hypothetical protein LJE96_16095 [Deltaproteobacteria bacterium]|nr:hypothetical protein [Deltaproteobacteria bacterium]